MTATRVDERSQTREIKTQTEAAVAFALNQDWRQAVKANVAVLRLGPNNIEALWRCEAFLTADRGKNRSPRQD